MIAAVWSLGWGAWWSILSYSLIDGYSQTGFTRPVDVDEDGDEYAGGVWNDWWPVTATLAVASLALGVWLMRKWVRRPKC